MEIRGYQYPPMDDLPSVRIKLVQAVSSLMASKVETFLVGMGFSPRVLKNDVGSGLELERGLKESLRRKLG